MNAGVQCILITASLYLSIIVVWASMNCIYVTSKYSLTANISLWCRSSTTSTMQLKLQTVQTSWTLTIRKLLNAVEDYICTYEGEYGLCVFEYSVVSLGITPRNPNNSFEEHYPLPWALRVVMTALTLKIRAGAHYSLQD